MRLRTSLVGATVVLASIGSLTGLAQSQIADARSSKPTPAQLAGTTPGSTRPGLTAAGLAKLTAAAPAKLWVSVTRPNSAPIDVKAEVLDGKRVVAHALARCVALSTAPHKLTLTWTAFTPKTLSPGDVLSVRVSGRAGTLAGDIPCASADASAAGPKLRVSFGSTSTPSSVGLTITPNGSKTTYLRSAVGAVSLTETKPTSSRAGHRDSKPLDLAADTWAAAGTWSLAAQCACNEALLPSVRSAPAAPKPEKISVAELTLPPAISTSVAGDCTAPTGCIKAGGGAVSGFQGGGWLPDGKEVTASVVYVGAPASPDPHSIYDGPQLLLVKTDGTTFADGNAWKCVTCGVDFANARLDHTDYPQPFADGKRVLWGLNVVQCDVDLASAGCTAANTHVYGVQWSGHAGLVAMREQRLHPDNVHIGFSGIDIASAGFTEYSYFGRFALNAATSTYDVTNVTRLFNPAVTRQPIRVDPKNKKKLIWDNTLTSTGELRGFSADGTEYTTIGTSSESGYTDVYAINLQTGKIRRLSGNQQYVDPLDLSPDGKWEIENSVNPSNRQTFMSGMHAIPPLTDLTTSEATASVRNNGDRRFFVPVLVDRYGGRGSYSGQVLTACAHPADANVAGSLCDPNWNVGADPRWSPNGTQVAFWQALAVTPACGGINPLVCETSPEQGGRTYRLMVASLTSRKPLSVSRPTPVVSDTVPWGTPVTTERPTPDRPVPPTGTYTLTGKVFGKATVTITDNDTNNAVKSVAVTYNNYSDDGYYVLNGTERVTKTFVGSLTTVKVDWFSNLKQTGCTKASKTTSAGGFHLTIDVLTNHLNATGTLSTTLNGKTYRQPANGT
jgi:hypothetical protein